mmetsp:Transcript_5234/g.11452  ORF Transcript_5234/g.11452 Transcript_5234/m.11452 type:complete len:353 (+) Transcript_5234:92-1150(+)|eukprot:CAMPEP_0202903374 /NCGR_PEP_ID=MMETSP1392-20130828/24119_1 /ASSEMBLY_ACC=CAM_ASM_000868 /TAXON_ID=225041 /ORGANISM="Chlamydomonas chlamydogama, Strain SAG 11-48b" /LENGTH=352 /DNA_ID=CAMNT_0049590521 /DNA_START=88 /DNA_END=1146 /DNA_ORIENTATION=+
MEEMKYLYLTGLGLAVLVFIYIMWNRYDANSKINKHPMLADMKLKKLPFNSHTRLRLEKASELFQQGWKILQNKKESKPEKCLQFFAKAVEIDEMACGWKKSFEEKLELIGDLFEVPLDNNEDKYHSMLAEAYLVVLLYTVLSLYGKTQTDLEEDYEVIKTRLTFCAQLQPKNPMVYKLRGDWSQRFGDHADKDACIADFMKAIKLTEKDTEGANMNLHGLEAHIQRSYILAYCHYHVAGLLQRKKEFDEAREHYEAVLEHADADLPQLPDTYYSLCILTLMGAKKADDKVQVLEAATRHYKAALEAEKRLLKWMPSTNADVSKKLAKAMLNKVTKANREMAKAAWQRPKTD